MTLEAIDVLIGVVVGVVAGTIGTPLLTYAIHAFRGRAGVLIDRLRGMARDNAVLASMVEQFGQKQKTTHDLLVSFAERAREMRDRQISAPGYLQVLQTDYSVWNQQLNEQLKPLLRYTEFQRLREPLLGSPPEETGTWNIEHREVRHWLRQRISELDRLLQAEYTSPNPYFAPSALLVAARHLPPGSES